jgi:tryptophan synthase beta chain
MREEGMMNQKAADTDRIKYTLDEADLPMQWYNIQADLHTPLPPVLHPGTGQPIGPQDLAPLFPLELIKQEVSQERWIDIPEEVRQVLRLWRPTPLFRARRLEQALDTPARIYYKYEGVSPVGSHKPNTSVPQAYYNKAEGVQRLSTETGAGQWGSALAMACAFFGLACRVYMVRISYEQKPYRRALMETYGATCIPSPSTETAAGRAILDQDPDTTGSLGIAISEAVEVAAQHPDTKYSLGSVLNHVLTHQTVIGQEALKQLDMAGDYPDVVVGCTGGGSNFAGIAFPFIGRKLRGEAEVRVVAAEPAACPSLTKGRYAYDFGDTSHLTPLVKMHTLGSTFVPPGFHAGGLRYHGMAPLVSHLLAHEEIEAMAIPQLETFAAGVQFARAEGILPAPEANHAVAGAIREALRCKEEGVSRTILFNLCGHGHFDMQAYTDYFAGQLHDYEYPAAKVEAALQALPQVTV